MLKRMTFLARRLDLSFPQFSNHWVGKHGEIVKRMPSVHGYVQNPVEQRLLTAANAEDPFSFDGIVELWFADAEAQADAFASAAAKELPVDEENFIRGITIYSVTEDRRSEVSGPVKVMIVARLADTDTSAAINALVDRLAWLPEAHVISVNHLGQAGWRDHLWHEPLPPNTVIEVGCESDAAAERLASHILAADVHRQVIDMGGALEGYIVRPRRII